MILPQSTYTRKRSRATHGRLWPLACMALAALLPLAGAAQFVKINLPFTYSEIPLLNVTTENGENPTFTIVYPPDGTSGASINSDYVPGRLTMVLHGDTVYDSGDYEEDASGVRIKIRGNSTGAYNDQKPYKIKLSKKSDLLLRDEGGYRHKDWALLSLANGHSSFPDHESDLLNVTGCIVNDIVGMEWTPQFTLANLVLNGEHKGLYYLTETVEKGDRRVDIDDSGYIVENDKHYWNEDVYFRTEKMHFAQGWTYKYPGTSKVTDEITERIKDFITDFENALYYGGDVSDYIDLHSFARWLLAQDIMGNVDGHGSNMYVAKQDYDPSDPKSSKLRMPTLWDFSGIFTVADSAWSNQHVWDSFYFPQLLRHDRFVEEYLKAWDEVSPTFMDSVNAAYDRLLDRYAAAFDQCRIYHRRVYPTEAARTMRTQAREQISMLEARMATMSTLIENLRNEHTDIRPVYLTPRTQGKRSVYDVYGRAYGNADIGSLPRGVYIVTDALGRTTKVSR